MLKNAIVDLMTAEYPNTLTNKVIANRLSAPEPSVRRATLQLERAGKLYPLTGGYSNVPLEWQGYAPKASH
jgi:DNA-binding IclR family transcriptional regulator